MPTVSNRKTIRIKSSDVLNQIEDIKTNFNLNENLIINEALRFGLPLYLEHLKSRNGLEPSSNPLFSRIIKELDLINDKLSTLDLLKENQIIQMAVQEVDEAIISSIYSRLKFFMATDPNIPLISDADDAKMDFRIPAHYKAKKEAFIAKVLTEEEDDDE